MLTTQTADCDRIEDNNGLEKIKNLIGRWILDGLGQPENLKGVQVRLLWPDHYRVNVLVGPDAASARVAHSFFLEANADGDIVGSTPSVTKQN